MDVEPSGKRLNPWTFVPLLYLMQAIPVSIVQEVSTVFYKDLGIANDPIATWTSLISLPWGLQLLLGPLVDLNGTKRRWILVGQFLIAFGLAATAFLLRVPHAFELSLVILGATAVTSALCNIATDGFYILSMAKDQQAKFVGVQTTCYRLGRLFCVGLLVLCVGLLTRVDPLAVEAPSGMSFATSAGPQRSLMLEIREGKLRSGQATVLGVNEQGDQAELAVPSGVYSLRTDADGYVYGRRQNGEERIGRLLKSSVGMAPAETKPGMSPVSAWTVILLACAAIYFLGHLVNRATVPHPAEDQPRPASEPNETSRNIARTFLLVGIGLSGYFTGNAVVRLVANAVYSAVGDRLKCWNLPEHNLVLGHDLGLGAVQIELMQALVAGACLVAAIVFARRTIRNTPMGDAFASFVRQRGIVPIFFFILFYRFGEAMVAKMSPLFLKGSLQEGGLAISNEQFGIIKGLAGVVGIICGGLLGGYLVGRLGLRKAFVPLAVCMHLPNLLYLWASTHTMPMAHAFIPGFGELNLTLVGVDFTDQFGYGFGYAAYIVYIMQVAQRGSYKTSHYAIGSGMGALCIALAGIVSGVIQVNFGWTWFFGAVMILSIPGLLSLLFIPLDEPQKVVA